MDFKNSVKKLLHLDIKNREKEFEKLKAELLQREAYMRSVKLIPENVLPIQKDFSAVFVPDSLSSLKKIRDHFKYFGVVDVLFLGTNLWQRGDVKSANFSFLFFNLPEKDNKFIEKSVFYKRFLQSYSYPPGHFEQRAYNTALFFKQALEENVKTRFAFQKKLQNIKNFQGAYYPLSVSKTQVFQYPLVVYKSVVPKAR